jgi:hypothetical protein
MTVKKQFAQDGVALDDCLDQLVEVLAQLLEEQPNPPAADADESGTTPAIAELHLGNDRAIHVVVNK